MNAQYLYDKKNQSRYNGKVEDSKEHRSEIKHTTTTKYSRQRFIQSSRLRLG